MSACPQCGTVAKPTDKFCNTCGTRLPEAAAQYAPPPQPPQAGFGAPAPQPGMQGGPARCQMGHDIAPGASYCAQGHPIALAAMQFAQDQYAQPPQAGMGQPPGYGQAPQAPGGMNPQFGGQPGGFAPQQPPQAPQYAPQAFGAPQAPQAPQQPPFGGQGGFGGYVAPPGAPAQPQPSASPIGGPPAYGDPNAGFGGGGFGQAPQAPQQPVFNPAAQPPQGMGQPAAAPKAPSQPPAPNFSAATTPDGATKTLRGFIVAYQANANGDFWPLLGGRHVVGRAGSGETVDIPLADPTISSKHAAFNVDGVNGTIAIEDTGSTNGTFVNEEHIGFNGRRDLKDGDRVRFGGFTTIVKVIGRL